MAQPTCLSVYFTRSRSSFPGETIGKLPSICSPCKCINTCYPDCVRRGRAARADLSEIHCMHHSSRGRRRFFALDVCATCTEQWSQTCASRQESCAWHTPPPLRAGKATGCTNHFAHNLLRITDTHPRARRQLVFASGRECGRVPELEGRIVDDDHSYPGPQV